MGGGRWRRAATRQIGSLCSCFHNISQVPSISTQQKPRTITNNAAEDGQKVLEEEQCGFTNKSMCAICLDPLSCTITPSSAVVTTTAATTDNLLTYTAECSHTFHLTCIASNIRHGSVTCPICRARWSHLPPYPIAAFTPATSDPVLQILEASIATSRTNRRSSLRSSARVYDDDDPLDPLPVIATAASTRLALALVAAAAPCRRHHLSVRLATQSPTDLVLVVSPNGPHLRLLKQAMSLVLSAFCSTDRLAIVTYSAMSATRAFPLRRMSPHGKRSALRVIDRLFFCLGTPANPSLGFQKAMKVLEDRSHRNSHSCMLHLSDSPTRQPGEQTQVHVPVPVHQFHVGLGFGMSNGSVIPEFQEFLGRVLGGVVREAKVRVGLDGEWVRLGEVRGGEERRVPVVNLKEECEFVCVGYSYIEGEGSSDEVVTGETVVGLREKVESCSEGEREVDGSSRVSSGEGCDYFDPFMARRWAKRLNRV